MVNFSKRKATYGELLDKQHGTELDRETNDKRLSG
jgi:hypothetical protein